MPTRPVLLLLLLVPAAAAAKDFKIGKHELSLSVTETASYSYRTDNGNSDTKDDNYHHVVSVLDLALSKGDARFGARFDLHVFAERPCDSAASAPPATACGNRYLNNYLIDHRRRFYLPERIYATAARPELDLIFGDFYASFGKGIALNVVKLDQLGQDTAIRGGKLIIHHSDLELTLLGGQVNFLDTDEATGLRAPWGTDPLVAGRIEYRFFDTVVAGAHGVFVMTDLPAGTGSRTPGADHHTVWGVSVELPNLRDGLLALAAEFDLQSSREQGTDRRGFDAIGSGLPGAAAYGSATLNLGGLTVLAEGKYYDDYLLGAAPATGEPYALLYSQPPTLERIKARIDGTSKIGGGRLKLEYNLGALGPVELRLIANYALFKSWFYAEDHLVHDAWGGFELQWQEGTGLLHVTSGMRREAEIESGQLHRRDLFVELDFEQKLAARHSLKLTSELVFRQEPNLLRGTTEDWIEGEVVLSYKWAPRLSLGVFYEHQGEPQIVREREKSSPLLGAESYLGGTAQYFFDAGTYLALRAGQNREGIKCLNGLCRRQPSFAGVQLSFVGRF